MDTNKDVAPPPDKPAMRGITLGESRIKCSLTPSDDSALAFFKSKVAELINTAETLRVAPQTGEKIRLIALCQTALEEAESWFQKAVNY